MEGFVDDPAVSDDALLLRRVPSGHFLYDHNLRRFRAKSCAFEDHPNRSPMSVLLASVLEEAGRPVEEALAGHEGFALAAIRAGLARQHGQGVARDPVPGEPAHAVVFGKKTRSVSRALAKGARWIVPPPDYTGSQQSD